MQKYFRPAVGIAAFVIGGIVARDKAFDVLDIVEKFLSGDKAGK